MSGLFDYLDGLPTYPFTDTMVMVLMALVIGYGWGVLRTHKNRDRVERERAKLRHATNRYRESI